MPVRPLNPELAEKAKVELKEDPKRLQDSIQILKDWIAKQPHLRARTDDQWLAAFVRGCKFSIELAKEKIDLYYSLRTIAPDLNLLKYNDPKFKEILKSGVSLVLPKTANPADPRVVILRAGHYEAGRYTPVELAAVGHAIQQIMLLEDDNFVVAGAVNVIDLKGSTMAHFTQMTPVHVKKIVMLYQDAAPTRQKAAHFVYTPTGFETIFNLAKHYLNEENKKTLHVHGKNYEALYKHVSIDILPAEYGGNGGTTQEIIDFWVKKVEEYSDWFEEDRQFGTDEVLRPGKPKTAEDTFGVDGSFRQLDFD